jgi:oxygen-independent coproporphyrinogen-3 oxidase
LGGGTPSLLSGAEMCGLLQSVKSGFTPDSACEITCEANPGTLTKSRLQEYRQAGINRLSLGVQSFNDAELRALDRIHTAAEAESSCKLARLAGFNNLSIDLIYGIPGQTLACWQTTLNKAMDVGPEHISMYGLTYEPHTRLTYALQNGRVQKCDEELEREMYLAAKETFESAGYQQYEISNFARSEFCSQHNQKYWDGSAYLGLGPSAHSFDGNRRWWNIRDVSLYCDRLEKHLLPGENDEILTDAQKAVELMMLGLRRRATL